MATQIKPVPLTQLQISHAIIAMQEYMQVLLEKAEREPQGGEHEDYLVAQSILRQLSLAQE